MLLKTRSISLILLLTFCINLMFSCVAFANSTNGSEIAKVDSSSISTVDSKSDDKATTKGLVKKAVKVLVKYAVKASSKVGRYVDDIWNAIESEVDNALARARNLQWDGPGGGERIFQIRDGSRELFRLDAKPINGGRDLYIHYHKYPNMTEHNDIITVPNPLY